MGLLVPTALVLLPLLGLIVIFYFLRLRRPETQVSSLFLWESLLRDKEANAPWQRLRSSLLLLLQLIVAGALILALARPWTDAVLAGSRSLVIVLDVSASMSSTDGPGGISRLEQARRAAWSRIDGLPANGQAALILSGTHAQVLSPSTSDHTALRRALDSVQVQQSATDMTEALALASSVAGGIPGSEIVVFSDGAFPDPRAQVPSVVSKISFEGVGNRGNNQGIVALAMQRAGGTLGLFVQVFNGADELADRRLDVALDGVPWAGRELTLSPGETQQLLLDDVPLQTQVVSAKLAGDDDNAVDDEAWTVNRLSAPSSVLLVTDGNRFLQNSLVLLPTVQLVKTPRADFAPMLTATLTVFDSIVPTATLPAGNLLFVNPPNGSALFEVSGTITEPTVLPPINGPDQEPLLRYTDFGSIHVTQAQAVPQPDWGRVVLDSDKGPLIIAGSVGGRRVAIITFDLHDSDLPLQISFPLLMRNLVGYLLPEPSGGMPASVAPGDPIVLSADLQEGANRVTVEGPDGTRLADYTLDAARPTATFVGTDKTGLYVVGQWINERELRRDGFTVNLLSAAESATLPVLTPPLPQAIIAAGSAPGEASRWEWWYPLAIIALLVLVIEWLASHALSLRRLGARLGEWRERVLPARRKEPA